MSPARRLLTYTGRYRTRYLAGAACLVAATGFALAIPWTVKSAVDALAAGRGQGTVALHASVILALAALHAVARLGSRFTMIGAGQWVEHDLRRDVHARLLALPSRFHQAHRTGDLMSRASNDVSAVRMLAGFGATMLLQTGLAFGGTLVAMWVIDPWLTVLALSPFPTLVVLSQRLSRAVEAQSGAVQDQLGALSAKVQENLAGVAVVRAYTMEAREIARFGGLNREYLARSLRLARTQSFAWPLMGFVGGLGTLVVLWAGGRAVVEGRLTLGAFVAFNGYLAHLAWPTIALGWTLANVRRGFAALNRIGGILDWQPPPRDVAPAVAAEVPVGDDVEVRDLTFAYDSRGPVLQEVSFRVEEGAFVVVVGPTGSGKSTLGALLVRLFEPPAGRILLGGVDVRSIPLEVLRRRVGLVPQEPFLFSRSLRDNVRLADETAADARLREATRSAALLDEVEAFPEGWDTVVGERGQTLSGGQRQRAALARALVAGPAVLVLDDPFAAVDPRKEMEILAALRAARAGRTTLLLTHRLRAAREADLVIVVAEGRVVERGTHGDLVAAGALYARLWSRQALEDALSEEPEHDPA